jgi:uracil-DNA glycosylase family 4
VAAKNDLRRYLEQRLELGETSIVLESLTTRQIRALPNDLTAAGADGADNAVGRRVSESPASPADRPQTMPDWRSALKESGAEPLAQKSDRAKESSASRVKAAIQLAKPGASAATDPPAALPPLDSLEAIATMVAGCQRCPLHATATNPVPGEGNPNADFMVVGEAPGATEDETGRPFVGRAGQLLTQILAAIQLKREDVFICNVLKHRPPGNRNPEANEVSACSPYLIRQIELIKPKVILALGTFSAQTLLDCKIPIGKLRGQIHQYHGVPVVVTYHPAALLRNPAWKRPTWEDVQLARRILDSAVPGA